MKNWSCNKGLLTISFLLFIFLSAIYSQESNSYLVRVPKFNQPVNIDGYLNESFWKNAGSIKDFYTFRPVDGRAATEKTAVLVGYDDAALYFAFICFDPSPEFIRASITKRDEIFDDDFIILYLDTFNEGKEAYQFAFNPYGIQADGIFIESVGEDFNPDFLFKSRGRRFKGGYIVEVEIPFKSVRFQAHSELTWGMAVLRRINHLDTDVIWPAVSRNLSTFVPQFGKLYGLKNVDPGNNIEILPEFTSSQHGLRSSDGFKEYPIQYDGGLNLKFGLTSNITVDLTYNPDFSQVEADADKIDVNRRFPLFYDEKRPFFLEGTSIFQTPINAVYTRRLTDPQAGIKLTGNVSGFQIGVLADIDDYYGSKEYLTNIAQAQQLYYDPALDIPEFLNKYLYQDSYHSIFRLKKDVWNYSNVGLLITDKQQKNTYSRTYGIDGNFIIANQYVFTFQALNSESSNYFDKGKKSDPAFYASLYRGSRTLGVQLYYRDVYPEFEVANGFLERIDYREGGAQIWYDFLSESSFFSLMRPGIFVNRMFDHTGNKIESYFSPSFVIETRGRTSLTLRYYRQLEEFYFKEFYKNQYAVEFSNKTLSWLLFDFDGIFGDGIYYTVDPFLGYVQLLNLRLEIKPMPNWATEFGLSNYLFHGWHNSVRRRINQDIYRIRTTYQFSRLLFLRLIFERNNYYKDIDINALLSYQLSPGTVVFLGYNDYFLHNGINDYKRYARGFFTKFSYLYRF